MDALAADGILYEQAISRHLGRDQVESLSLRVNSSGHNTQTAARVPDDAVLYRKTKGKGVVRWICKQHQYHSHVQSQSGI